MAYPKPRARVQLGPKREQWPSGWGRDVTIGEHRYRVGVSRGRRARGMYGVQGWHWVGWVMRDGRALWSGRVPKSAGATRILYDAWADRRVPELDSVWAEEQDPEREACDCDREGQTTRERSGCRCGAP